MRAPNPVGALSPQGAAGSHPTVLPYTPNTVSNGTGAPDPSIGYNSQFYYDTSTTPPTLWVNDAGTWVQVSSGGGRWVPTVGTPGRKPGASEELFNTPISFKVQLPAGLVGSVGNCEVAPTADAVFQLFKTGVSIGSVKFPAGLVGPNVAVFTMAVTEVFNQPTDTFSCVSPASQDATLSGVALQFLGSIL